MKTLPYTADIYDMETRQLEQLLVQIDTDSADPNCELPDRFDNYEKYRKKALKLREHVELEVEERSQVDNVLSFFTGSKKDDEFLDDDAFYKPLAAPQKHLPTIPETAVQPRQTPETNVEESKSEAPSYLPSERLEPDDNVSQANTEQKSIASGWGLATRSKVGGKPNAKMSMKALLARTKISNSVT